MGHRVRFCRLKLVTTPQSAPRHRSDDPTMATAAVTFPRAAKQALATVTQEGNGVWLLSMHNLPDNRLLPEFIKQALLPALDHVELAWHRAAQAGNKNGALVLTGERDKGKFFSNGLQLEVLADYPTFFRDYYYKLLSRVMTFPLHTIAAVNGHFFAGGLCLALACDWRICRPDRTWGSMNEVHFGAPIPAGMAAVLSARLPEPVLRKVLLTGHRYTAQEALKEAATLSPLAATGVLRAMKQTIYAPVIAQLAKNEPLSVGGPQAENEALFKALVAAEVSAKL